jgi:hypothetical protein
MRYRLHVSLNVTAVCSALALTAAFGPATKAAPFSGGVVVERIGGDANFQSAGSFTGGTATPVFLDEFSQASGTRTQTIALPSTDPDAEGPQRMFNDNAGNNVGFMTRSVDGNYLVTVGSAVAAGTTGMPGDAAVNNRIIARVDAAGNIDTSTGYSHDGLGAGNSTPRSAATVDGTSFYVGTGNNTAGTRYIDTFGVLDAATDRIAGATSQTRAIGIFGGRFFYSNNANYTLRSVKDSITGGLPTSDANVTVTDLITVTSPLAISSPEQFVLLDLVPSIGFDGTGLDTLYITNLAAIAGTTNPTSGTDLNTGGLQKWTFDDSSSTFVQQITYNSGLSSVTTDPLSGGLQGLTFVGLDDGNNPILYASTGAPATTGNALVKFIDTGAAASFTHVATAPVNSAFRGVALAPGSVSFLPTDFNESGTVDGDDLAIWKMSFGTDPGADADGDGDSDGEDFLAWQRDLNIAGGPAVGLASAVPEPSTVVVMGMALAALAAGRRSRLQ